MHNTVIRTRTFSSSPCKHTYLLHYQLKADKVQGVPERAGEVCGFIGSFFH